jgi:hypothetical protein
MRVFDIADDPAVEAVDQNKIQRDSAALVVEGGGDIGLEASARLFISRPDRTSLSPHQDQCGGKSAPGREK